MTKEILINGGLRANNRDIRLTLYSTPLARLLIKEKIKFFNVEFNSNVFILTSGNQRSISFERVKSNNHISVLRVAKIIPKELKVQLKSIKKQKKVKVLIKNSATEKDLLVYNNLIKYVEVDGLDLNIPEFEKIKVGCHISRGNDKNSSHYRLSLRHRILEEITIKKEKVAIARNKEGEFILRKHEKGRLFGLYKNKQNHPLSYMQISPSLITEKEKIIFRSGKKCISYKAYLSSTEFNVDISKFFMTKDEKELAQALLKRNINIRLPEMRKREADIVLRDSGIQIELTHLKPRIKENKRNNPHSEGVHINARLCEGYLKVIKNKTPLYFVIFDELWLKYKWVNDLILEVKPHVRCITTNFELGWEEKGVDKIISILKKRGFLK